MDRKQPQPGERWRHYKLKEEEEYIATIIAIASRQKTGERLVIYSEQENQSLPVVAQHTESEIILVILSMMESQGIIAAWETFPGQIATAWARPLDNFMGVVSSPYGAEASNCYRFERIE